MIRGRLILECAPGELDAALERFAHGPVDVMLEDVEIGASGERLRHHLRPQSIVTPSVAAIDADDLPDERTGPLLRLYATHPPQEA